MSDTGTIRERIERASAFFAQLDAVVLTTFNLSGTFLEDQALPTVLGVEGKSAAARRAVMAGRSEDGTTWVYLSVSSANLTLSGWGRNAESFGELWIHTRKQQGWQALDKLLRWLETFSPLGEEKGGGDAVQKIRAALKSMPDRKRFVEDGTEPWSGALRGQLYSSVVHTEGFPNFLQMGRARPASSVWAYSPYWSDVAEQVAAFNGRETILIPSLRSDGAALGMSQDQSGALEEHTKVQRNPGDVGMRFWHMKAYGIHHGDTAFSAVGSCNFTKAGLCGVAGNVEAMLVFKADPDWLPKGKDAEFTDLASECQEEEEAPTPTPIAIVVAWDWRAQTWRWWLNAGPFQHDFVLELPGLTRFPIDSGTQAKPGKPPARGATFTVTYRTAKREKQWQGNVVELNLDYSSRIYGRPLTANEILDSWRGHAPSWDLGGGGGVVIQVTMATMSNMTPQQRLMRSISTNFTALCELFGRSLPASKNIPKSSERTLLAGPIASWRSRIWRTEIRRPPWCAIWYCANSMVCCQSGHTCSTPILFRAQKG